MKRKISVSSFFYFLFIILFYAAIFASNDNAITHDYLIIIEEITYLETRYTFHTLESLETQFCGSVFFLSARVEYYRT